MGTMRRSGPSGRARSICCNGCVCDAVKKSLSAIRAGFFVTKSGVLGQQPFGSYGEKSPKDCAEARYVERISTCVWERNGRWIHHAHVCSIRSIPTPVGEMRSTPPRRASAPVHPHARGADSLGMKPRSRRKPVHPHARGADGLRGAAQHILIRFIPTPVGQMPPGAPERPPLFRFIPTPVGQISC